MNILELKNVTKKYPKFVLDKVSFKVESGKIIGFIGRNGAGKTTTIKGIMNLIHLDGGEVYFNDKLLKENEDKEQIALLINGVDFFPERSIKTLTSVTKRFYKNWDDDKYYKYLKYFELDENKKIKQLSQGMKIKYQLSLALSHNAQLLILDEPTSGLDPISREEVLDIFLKIVENENRAILFSTHITSDLEKVADDIVYIRNGKIVLSDSKTSIKNEYKTIKGLLQNLEKIDENRIVSYKKYSDHFEGLIRKEEEKYFSENDIEIKESTIEEIMIFLEREEGYEEFSL